MHTNGTENKQNTKIEDRKRGSVVLTIKIKQGEGMCECEDYGMDEWKGVTSNGIHWSKSS